MFFPPEDTPLLYPLYANSIDAIFEVDLSRPDLTRHPLLSLTHPRQVTLEAGEVLYVPAGCPHRVENLEKSLAISANFVDTSNFELVKKELSASALVDEHAKQLLAVMKKSDFGTGMKRTASEVGTGMKRTDSEVETGSGVEHGLAIDAKLCIPWSEFKRLPYHSQSL